MMSTIKSFLQSEQTFYVLVVLLVGVCGYALGKEAVFTQIEDSNQNQAAVIFTDVVPTERSAASIRVVVSKNGTKYHRLDCPGANSIKESNKVYFDSIDLARSAGYTPAANCDW